LHSILLFVFAAEANSQLLNLQDDLSRRVDDNLRQQDEITHLLTQVVELQKRNRDLGFENEGFRSALEVSHDCQKELSTELLDIKEKYDVLLAAFHDLQQELKNKNPLTIGHFPPSYIHAHESLAAELESTLASEGYGSDFSSFLSSTQGATGGRFLETRCDSPDSLMSVENPSFFRSSTSHADPTPSKNTRGEYSTNVVTSTSAKVSRLADKLKNLKPFEGSGFLRRWRRLATPHLGVILEPTNGVQSKAIRDLNADLLQYMLEVKKRPPKNPVEAGIINETTAITTEINHNETHPGKSFQSTSFTYTFTTTAVSRSSESTIMTPSFSSVQLSTGHDTPITTSFASFQNSSITSYDQGREEVTGIKGLIHCHGREHSVFSIAQTAATSLTFSTQSSCVTASSSTSSHSSNCQTSPKKKLETLTSPTGLSGLDFLTELTVDVGKAHGVITRGTRTPSTSSEMKNMTTPPNISPTKSCALSLKTKTGCIVSGKITKTKTFRKGGLV
jgi:hypothetical protein